MNMIYMHGYMHGRRVYRHAGITGIGGLPSSVAGLVEERALTPWRAIFASVQVIARPRTHAYVRA